MVEFGGATFFETDDWSSRQGGVVAKTLTFYVAKPNTIFSEGFFVAAMATQRFFA
jgi:hypothetical protein